MPTAAFLGAILLFSEAPMYAAIQNGIGFWTIAIKVFSGALLFTTVASFFPVPRAWFAQQPADL